MAEIKTQKLESREDLELLMPKDTVFIEDFGEMCLVEKNEAALHFIKREKENLIQASLDIYDHRIKIIDNKIKGSLYIRAINKDNQDYQKYNKFLEGAGQ